MKELCSRSGWRSATVALASACLWLVGASTASALSFDPPAFLPAGTQPHSVVAEDFNGDGFPDLASANIYSDDVSIHLGDGSGNFAPAAFHTVGNNPEVVVPADFNGDGFPDLATANITSDNVSVLLNDGTGNFLPATNFPVGDGPHSITTADFDGDGFIDIATSEVWTDTITILLGDGSGSFGPATSFPLTPGSFPTSLAAGDFDGDGDPDLVATNMNTNKLAVLPGDGSGGLGPATYITAGTTPVFVTTGDLNGDGYIDIANANGGSDDVSVFLGDGTGNFGVATFFGTGPGSYPDSIISADFDGDGNPDLATGNYFTDSVSVLTGDGSGSFGPPAGFSTGPSTFPVSVAAADFNSDGVLDLATANFLPNYLSVLPGVPTLSDVKITKTASPTNPRPGDIVTYSLEVENTGGSTATGVEITDSLPVGVTFVSADSPCTEALATVTCAIGSLAPGASVTLEVKVRINQWGTVDPTAEHLLDVQRVEAQIDLNPGEQRTIQVRCPSGFFVSDGSVRTDHVDQGTGDWTTSRVLESRASSLDTWQGTVQNTATGRSQAKVFAVCIRQVTNQNNGHDHGLIVTDPITVSDTVVAGQHEAVLACGPGQVAIQPGYHSTGPAELEFSQPQGNGWKFRLNVSVDSDITSSIRCLTRQVAFNGGHTHDLELERIWTEVEIQAGKVHETQLTCRDGSKGIVGGWDFDHGLFSLGNDPRPVTRAFRIYNPTDHPLKARLSLLCLGDRTGGEHAPPVLITNTAHVSTASDELSIINNMSSASVTAEDTDNHNPVPNPPTVKPVVNNPIGTGRKAVLLGNSVGLTVTCAGPCGGTAKLFAGGTLLASGSFEFRTAASRRVKLRITRRGKRLLKQGKAVREGSVWISNQGKRRVRIRR